MSMLKVGDQAPDFSGLNQNDEKISLKDFRGKKLVLFFYPKDNTPGCTKEVCSLRDGEQALLAKGYNILGVSADSSTKHKNFISKFSLPFDLLADTDLSTIKAYGCWGLKKFMGKEYEGIIRTTFLICEDGKIEQIISKVKTGDHANQILESIS